MLFLPLRKFFAMHHPNPLPNTSKIPCSTPLPSNALHFSTIWLDYTKLFGLITNFDLAWIHLFIIKPNRKLYSSQIESCIQNKYLNQIRQQFLVALSDTRSRRWVAEPWGDEAPKGRKSTGRWWSPERTKPLLWGIPNGGYLKTSESVALSGLRWLLRP